MRRLLLGSNHQEGEEEKVSSLSDGAEQRNHKTLILEMLEQIRQLKTGRVDIMMLAVVWNS